MATPHRTNTAKAAPTGGARGLAELLANRKIPTVLLADIRAHVLDAARKPDPERNPHALHPSDICRTGWCPRANLERLRGSVSTRERQTFSREAVFTYGHDAHARWQRWMTQMSLLEGYWRCLACESRFYARAPKWCDCGSALLVYDELPLQDPDLMIEGRTDGYVPERHCLVEIKTVGEGTVRYADPALLERHTYDTPRGTVLDLKGLWDAIHKPFVAHLRQGQIYLYLARTMGIPVDRMVYLYDSKLSQDAKEFSVKYDKSLIKPILTGAAQIKLALDGVGPDPACRFPGACRDCEALT